jgi:hypothetical protein
MLYHCLTGYHHLKQCKLCGSSIPRGFGWLLGQSMVCKHKPPGTVLALRTERMVIPRKCSAGATGLSRTLLSQLQWVWYACLRVCLHVCALAGHLGPVSFASVGGPSSLLAVLSALGCDEMAVPLALLVFAVSSLC